MEQHIFQNNQNLLCLMNPPYHKIEFEVCVKIQNEETMIKQEQINYEWDDYFNKIQQKLIKNYAKPIKKIQKMQATSDISPIFYENQQIIKISMDDSLQNNLKLARSRINKLWLNVIYEFLQKKIQSFNTFDQFFIGYKKSQSKTRITNIKFKKILISNPWIKKIIFDNTKNFIESIYFSQKLYDEQKFILIQTYQIFLQAIQNPQNFQTWDIEKIIALRQSTQIYQKLKDKSFFEIHEIALYQFKKQKQRYKKLKCSLHNNLTYYWTKYIKDMINNSIFKERYQKLQQYEQIQKILLKPATISHLKSLFQINWFSQVMIEQKLKTKQIIKQIFMNPNLNLLNKLNMIISLEHLSKALIQPSSLKAWFK